MVTNKHSRKNQKNQTEVMEQALREQEKKINTYREIFNFASDGVLIHGVRNGVVKEANQKAMEMFGYTRAQMLKLDIAALSKGEPPYSRDEVKQKMAQVKGEESLLFEWVCKKKDKSLFWAEVHLKKAVFEEETVMIAIIRDISGRKKTEADLERSQVLSKAIQRLGKVGAWEMDIASRTSFWTEEVYRIHELPPESGIRNAEYFFHKSLPCFHPDDRQIIRDAFQKCIRDGTPYRLEMPFTTVMGRKRWVQTEARRVDTHIEKGRIIGYFRDISALKKHEEALRINEIRYRTILQTAVDGFLLVNQDGKVIEANDAYCRMSGYDKEELPGMAVPDLDGQMKPDEVHSKIETVKKNGYDRFETKHQRKDGSTYDAEVSVTYIHGEEGLFVNFIRDISALKKTEKEKEALQDQLNQIQKMESIGRLAGGVAHDLNNLLAPILGYSEMLMIEKGGTKTQQEQLNAIFKSGTKARNLVRQLLAFSRKQTLDFQFLDLDKVLLDFKALICRTIREDIRIDILPSPGTKPVKADQTQLEQIIMNLSVNAADAMPDGGVLTIQTDITRLDDTYARKHPGVQPGQYVKLCFTDTGQGMDRETCRKIFEPFFSTKGKHGTGLGLATVYGIVKQHSGNIWVYSELGKGSVFKVYLPLAPGQDPPSPAEKKSFHDLAGTETILLAEDNGEVRKLIEEILTKNGYQVFTAGNGNDALETWAAMDTPVDLLVTDVIMPEMNGRELFVTLQSMDPELRVLFISGYPDDAVAHHGIGDYHLEYLQKPFNTNEFLRKIREVLDREGQSLNF